MFLKKGNCWRHRHLHYWNVLFCHWANSFYSYGWWWCCWRRRMGM